MADPSVITAYIQGVLVEKGLTAVDAVTAAKWLDGARLLRDSASRPGKPLRDLLRAGQIGGQRQAPNGRWTIELVRPLGAPAREDPTPRLQALATLIRVRNALDLEIARLLGRPASAGNLGEYVAAAIFDIELAKSGVNPGHDGIFRSGSLAGRTVNVKLYSEDAGLVDVGRHPSDYYLVMTGPRPTPGPALRTLPRRIDAVYLFETKALLTDLANRGVGIGVASSVRKQTWEAAKIFPAQPLAPLALSEQQVGLLQLFAP